MLFLIVFATFATMLASGEEVVTPGKASADHRRILPKYSSPVNYDVVLAGNFGEPRPNHFHGGVDVFHINSAEHISRGDVQHKDLA